MAKSSGSKCPVPAGILVIIGGAENKGNGPTEKVAPENFIKLEVLKTFVEVIKKRDPAIEVITTSSGEGEESFKNYQKLFHELGIKDVGHIHHNTRKEALDEHLIERVDTADGFFFTGGNQLLLTSIYGGTTFLTRLKERYIRNRIVIGGTSAGAMALSTPMIYAGEKEVEEITGEIKITTGLEFLKDVCIDTHFVERGRFVRMAQVIVTNPTCIGLGIEEDTAVIVRNGCETEVIGSGIVIIMDGFHIASSNVTEFVEKKAISIRELKVHLLPRGETYVIPQINPPHR